MEHQDKDRLWDEYKYRHTHVWNTVFKLTAAVVLISIIPYTKTSVACVLGRGIYIFPSTAVAVGIFGLARLYREFKTFDRIKIEYRKEQGLVNPQKSSFKRDVVLFIGGLILLASINFYVIGKYWGPAIAEENVEKCFEKIGE